VKVITKEFSTALDDKIKKSILMTNLRFDLNPGKNVYLICEKLFNLSGVEGCLVECGVFEGKTILTAAFFRDEFSLDLEIVGVDSFNGFPAEYCEHDLPERFEEQFKENKITLSNYTLAKERTDDFSNKDHLESEYFENINNIRENIKLFKDLTLLEGSFKDVLQDFDKPIKILHLDCDLFESYKVCLSKLYDNVVPGGTIIFDEYYSYKYPGPRTFIDYFFADKQGYFEKYMTDDFERWAFVKE
jgi:hypothetical protein